MKNPVMLKNLRLEHFRSHTALDLELGNQTVLVGPNGAGKTNMLEAVFFLATTSSFRTSRENVLIEAGQDVARVVGDDLTAILQADGNRTKKQFRLRGVTKRLVDIPGELPVVLFSPELLQIFAAGPVERRRLFNIAISQHDRLYSARLGRFKEIVRQRNALLQAIRDNRGKEDELNFWDTQVITEGEAIMAARAAHLEAIIKQLPAVADILPGAAGAAVEYKPSTDHWGTLEAALKANLRSDIRYGQTTVGPHRDDFVFLLGGRPVALYGSRGEWRRVMLSYQFAELLYLESLGKQPLLLLDDAFSELDESHRLELSDAILERNVLLTTTEVGILSDKLKKSAKIITISK